MNIKISQDFNKMESILRDCLDEIAVVDTLILSVDDSHIRWKPRTKKNLEIYLKFMRVAKKILMDFSMKKCPYKLI